MDDEAFGLLERFEGATQLETVLDGYGSGKSKVAEVVSLLLQLGFVEDLDQPTAIRETGRDQMLASWLHVTNACNLGCHYCYVSKTAEHMTEDTSRQAVDAIIRSAVKNGYSSVHITYAGGEASLQLPQVIKIHDYALLQAQEHDLQLFAGMISNGVAMPVRFIEQLKQRKIGLAISLDGVGADHDQQRPLVNGAGSFTFVDRTITRLLAHGLIPNINVTVSQRNLASLPRLLAYILEKDLPFGLSYYRDNECSTQYNDLQFSDAEMISGMRNAFAYIEAHLPNRTLLGALVDKTRMYGSRQHGCGVGRSYMAINQRGGIASCQVDIANPVTSIHADNPLQVIRDNRLGVQGVSVDEKEGCKSCQWRYWCTGGCAMLTYRLTGRSDIKSPNCAIYKALFPDALRLEAARLLKYTAPITF
ncbi:hypothetical protein KDA_68860 [Dictyobacter alpinus]|uniref:Radical SAM core domain-containing protein n=1 Tax=Dictyobacter alpinus TaxID=2014873 RepID=A0A402BJ98_9CHLR|nr:hypothetical protein KDA_68860 [Dictyobacter alpinus]